MSEFTLAEKRALAVLVQHAAKRCGAGEDTMGAILYTGAFRMLPEQDRDKAIARLAHKIDEHLPPGEPADWIKTP